MKRLCLVLTPIYSFYHTRPVPTVERENGSGKLVKRIEKQAFQLYCLVLNLIPFFFNIIYMPFGYCCFLLTPAVRKSIS